jgi:DNA replication protein DnaC
LTYGDVVVVRPVRGDKFIEEFVGFIMTVDKIKELVFVNFSEALSKVEKGTKFFISFPFCKHFMFDLLINSMNEFKEISLFFPSDVKEIESKEELNVKFEDNALNDEQKKCCRDVLNNLHKGAPYSIFGPPGTGKTRTLIEMIKLG